MYIDFSSVVYVVRNGSSWLDCSCSCSCSTEEEEEEIIWKRLRRQKIVASDLAICKMSMVSPQAATWGPGVENHFRFLNQAEEAPDQGFRVSEPRL